MNSRRIIGCKFDDNGDHELVYADGSSWFLCGDLDYNSVYELGEDIDNLINEKEIERQIWINKYFRLKKEIKELHNYMEENEKLKERIKQLELELQVKDAEIDECGNFVFKEVKEDM